MRTTPAAVKSVIATGLEDSEVDSIIALANRMVTNALGTSSLAADVLTDIETWLTAHMISIGKERQTSEERVDTVWIKFQGTYGQALRSTSFGQMVLMLDTTGLLDRSTKRKVTISAIPQDPDQYE